jgi:hypothetical protein
MPQLQILLPILQRHLLSLNPFEQLIEINRLLVVIGNPCPQGLDHILLVRTPSQHDRLEGPVLAGHPLQLLHQLNPVHVRHMQITQHQADLQVFAVTGNGLLARFTGNAAIAARLQKLAKFFNNQRLIINHEDFYCRGEFVHAPLHARSTADRSCTKATGRTTINLKSRRTFRLCT